MLLFLFIADMNDCVYALFAITMGQLQQHQSKALPYLCGQLFLKHHTSYS
jgi:hypothetical protein